MSILKLTLLFLLSFSHNIWAQIYIDQKDDFFIAHKIIPKTKESSLCGPVTFINWLIFENKIKKQDGFELLKFLNQSLIGGINHGHTNEQLLSLIEKTENELGLRGNYESKDFYQIRLDDIQNKKIQILLLRFQENAPRSLSRSQGYIPYDDLMMDSRPKSFMHFVLKIPAANGKIQIIDPEQPDKKIILGLLETNQKIVLSNEHYQYFGYTGLNTHHDVQVIGTISKKD